MKLARIRIRAAQLKSTEMWHELTYGPGRLVRCNCGGCVEDNPATGAYEGGGCSHIVAFYGGAVTEDERQAGGIVETGFGEPCRAPGSYSSPRRPESFSRGDGLPRSWPQAKILACRRDTTMCTAADHDRLRADPIELRRRTVFVGVQPAENGNPELELRNCECCVPRWPSSTLCRWVTDGAAGGLGHHGNWGVDAAHDVLCSWRGGRDHGEICRFKRAVRLAAAGKPRGARRRPQRARRAGAFRTRFAGLLANYDLYHVSEPARFAEQSGISANTSSEHVDDPPR